MEIAHEAIVFGFVPFVLLVLEFYFHEFTGDEIEDGAFEACLDQAFDSPRFAAFDGFAGNDRGLGAFEEAL